jgi:isopenicillin N synthase-like dioxygenase
MIVYTPPKAPTSIPIVDLAQTDAKAAAAIHIACRETGFFTIANHGIPQTQIDAQFDFAKRFFDLPIAEKLSVHMSKSPTTAGYEPIGGQRLDSQDAMAEAAPPDLKESFYCGTELGRGHPLAMKRLRGFGHNQWPANLPGFRDQMLLYHAAMRALADRLLSLIAVSLELEADWFVSSYDAPVATLRLIKYPPQPRDAAFNQIGAGAHTDWGDITLLAQDGIGGLEVQNASGDWIEAKPVPGTFVINIGDLMARRTNGIYTSNMHRVKNNSGERDRYSIPFFYSPRPADRADARLRRARPAPAFSELHRFGAYGGDVSPLLRLRAVQKPRLSATGGIRLASRCTPLFRGRSPGGVRL